MQQRQVMGSDRAILGAARHLDLDVASAAVDATSIAEPIPIFSATCLAPVERGSARVFDGTALAPAPAGIINVLAVTGDRPSVALIREQLDKSLDYRFTVDWVVTGSEALGRLNQRRYDVVLIACDFPDFSNLELLTTLSPGATPAIVLTAVMNRAARQEALARGAADYLTHDDLQGRLLERSIRYAIETHRARAALAESENRFSSTFDDAATGMAIESIDGRVLRVNRAFCAMLGHQPDKLHGRPISELMHPEDVIRDEYRRRELLDGVTDCYSAERRYIDASGNVVFTTRSSSVVRSSTGEPLSIIVQLQDISAHKRAELLAEQQLARLSALRAIDLAIIAPTSLKEKLDVALDQVLRTLKPDAAAILLADEKTGALRHAASRGFREGSNVRTRCDRGLELAYRSLRERTMIALPDIRDAAAFAGSGVVLDEPFRSYAVVALVAQDRAYGVMEIYRRQPLPHDDDGLNFFQAIATQTAIAIENAALIEDLSKSSHNLKTAYDRTLEGWSRALEMRDDETNGHSQRVTELTVRLARRFGFASEELDNIRRGALLHDIGKMAIPDNILLKRGPLTPSEREIMRRHPVYAYDLLSKIPFLEGALDIPYAHHEKWDGTGYPRRLAGAEIPFAARIFSIVDVWDALTSNRPYRPAWTPEAARAYIRSQSGHHFDPLVVREFLNLDLPGADADRH